MPEFEIGIALNLKCEPSWSKPRSKYPSIVGPLSLRPARRASPSRKTLMSTSNQWRLKTTNFLILSKLKIRKSKQRSWLRTLIRIELCGSGVHGTAQYRPAGSVFLFRSRAMRHAESLTTQRYEKRSRGGWTSASAPCCRGESREPAPTFRIGFSMENIFSPVKK